MTASVSFQPFVQSVGNNGLFNATSTGARQGTAYPDLSTRYRLRAGILSTTETLPMWGGVGLYGDIGGGSPGTVGSPGNPSYSLGAIVGRATALTGSKKLVGFSVFDEAYGMVTSPQSTVPLAGSGGQVNWYALGTLARIWVQCDPSLVSLRGSSVLPGNVSWDFTNQLLIPEEGTLTISSGTYNSTTGQVVLTMSAPITFDVGDSITTSSLTASGGGAGNIGQLDGTWTTIPTTSGSTVTFDGPTGLGAITITGGSLTVGGAASAALPVEVLDVQSTNCEVVEYNTGTGFATWNYQGAAALISLNPNG